jgi:hypothetical protein
MPLTDWFAKNLKETKPLDLYKECARAILIIVVIIIAIMVGQMNANIVEEQIEKYCGCVSNLNYSVNEYGFSAVLWREKPVVIFNDTNSTVCINCGGL